MTYSTRTDKVSWVGREIASVVRRADLSETDAAVAMENARMLLLRIQHGATSGSSSSNTGKDD